LAQDDYYYEIQLTNKQLVFYFMAGAAGLILSFLTGVMVGRSVEGSAAGATEGRPVTEERVVAEQSPTPSTGTPEPGYTYPGTLEGDRPDDRLERPAGAAATPVPTPTPRPATPAATARPAPPTPAPTLPPPPAPRAGAAAPLPKALASTASGFAIQVGAFKDRASADGVVKSLKARGLPAYAVTPTGGGFFTVRVGVYRDRADAEVVRDRLRDDKFQPYILKQ
jgi:cell division protein FtsN